MGVLQGLGDRQDDPEGRLLVVDLPLVQLVLDGGPLDVLHHEVVAAVGLAGVDDADDVVVRELGGDLGLAVEPLDELPIARRVVAQDLDGDDPVDADLAGLEDDPHRALADPAEDLVAGDLEPGPGRPGGSLIPSPRVRMPGCCPFGPPVRSWVCPSGGRHANASAFPWVPRTGYCSRIRPDRRRPGISIAGMSILLEPRPLVLRREFARGIPGVGKVRDTSETVARNVVGDASMSRRHSGKTAHMAHPSCPDQTHVVTLSRNRPEIVHGRPTRGTPALNHWRLSTAWSTRSATSSTRTGSRSSASIEGRGSGGGFHEPRNRDDRVLPPRRDAVGRAPTPRGPGGGLSLGEGDRRGGLRPEGRGRGADVPGPDVADRRLEPGGQGPFPADLQQ